MDTQLTTGNEVLSIIDRAPGLADRTRAQYRKALAHYLDTGQSVADAVALADYARNLPTSSKAFLKAAVRLVIEGAEFEADAQASPNNILAVLAIEKRGKALREAIHVEQSKGQKAHTWLTLTQVKALLDTCDVGTLQGERDRLALGLLVGAGLRREEAVTLAFADVKLQPVKGKMRTVLSIVGKGEKARTIPIRDELANALDRWGKRVTYQGRVLRSIDRRSNLRDSLSAVGLFNVVRKHGAAIGLPALAAHDLRRTFAQIGVDAGVPLQQISRLLGHASLTTTQRYLNLELNLESTVSDFVPF